MTCPRCKGDETTVYASRYTAQGNKRRYRKCITCGMRFSTIEYYVPDAKARGAKAGAKKRRRNKDLGDYPGVIENQFDNMTGSMNLCEIN